MNWIREVFGTEKPIIAMCHMQPMPGDPYYSTEKGMDYVVETTRRELLSLQEGGVDAVMFSNEFSLPYLTDVRAITPIAMARVIGELRAEIKIPYGVNVLWDAEKSIDLASATGAAFVREIFTGVYASDFGVWNTDCGRTVRHQREVNAQNVRLLFNIIPEAAKYMGDRDIAQIAKTTVFNCRPDALCVSGITAGSETDVQVLRIVKEAVPDTFVFANTGVRTHNVKEQLQIADGAVVGTTFKEQGRFENRVDVNRVREFMDTVHSIRKGSQAWA